MGRQPNTIEWSEFEPTPVPKTTVPDRAMVGKFILAKETGENLSTFEHELMKLMGDFKDATGAKISGIIISFDGEVKVECKKV